VRRREIGIGRGGFGAEMLRKRAPVIAGPKGPLSLIGAKALEKSGVEGNLLQKRPKPVLAATVEFPSPS